MIEQKKHFNKCLITSLGSDSVCELTELDRFDIKMSHINVYIASQKKTCLIRRSIVRQGKYCTFYTSTNKALTFFSTSLPVFIKYDNNEHMHMRALENDSRTHTVITGSFFLYCFGFVL